MSKAKQHRPPLLIALALVLAALLAWAALTAARNGLSDFYARPAIDYLEQKRFDAYSVSDEEWRTIEQSILKAHQLMPHNPRYLASLGWLNQLKLASLADNLTAEEKDVHANAASYYFQQAVENRPTWSYYWGNLAIEQYRRGEYSSDEYSLALANASQFGPWKNDMQRLVLDFGGETWELLSPGAQREIILNVERGLLRQPQNTIMIVRAYGAWPKLCETGAKLLDITTPHFQTLCAQDGFTE
ncbi:MAG: hypothetical protein AB8G18_08800 [Gammaproteobacteria bacterium]